LPDLNRQTPFDTDDFPIRMTRRDHSPDLEGATGVDVANLAGLPLFDGLSPEQLEIIAQHAVQVEVPAGKELVRDAALAWDFYVITAGSAQARRGDTSLGELGPGDFFGEVGVLASDRRRMANVVSTSPLTAIRLTKSQVETVSNEVPEFAERLRAAAAERDRL
jgi:CRP-like cAMP-binding protein